jgi:hypothetical protein
VPENNDQQALRTNYFFNLQFILNFLESNKQAVLMSTYTFKKWLHFIRYLPEINDPRTVFSHVEKMMHLSQFSKAILQECVKEFIKDRVMGPANSFSKHDSLAYKKKCFEMVTRQLMVFGMKESDLQDIHMFNSMFRLLLVEPWSQESNASLLSLLPTSLHLQFKDEVIQRFSINVKNNQLTSLNFTLPLFSEIFKLQTGPDKVTLMQQYLDFYNQSK